KPGDSIPAKIEEGWNTRAFRFRDPLNKDRRFIRLQLDDPIKGSLAHIGLCRRPPRSIDIE
ncbi:MAG: hypothetical protein L0Z50_29755, partial [Verrucomicrobiales bacterium]|nr:hypothetical protein [Verrucomicrobiales bacterium]